MDRDLRAWLACVRWDVVTRPEALLEGLASNEVAAVFRLEWLCQGRWSVLLPDVFTAVEAAGSWEHGSTALVLLAWPAAAAVLCLKGFRWTAKKI